MFIQMPEVFFSPDGADILFLICFSKLFETDKLKKDKGESRQKP